MNPSGEQERRVAAAWLALRERADAAARSTALVAALRGDLDRATREAGRPWVVHDLGCGTGAMLRWLAPRLPGPQHWVLHDRDAALLEVAASAPPVRAADGTTVTVEARCDDVTRLPRGQLGDAALVTTSALLDLLTRDELERLVDTCARMSCPTLLTLSVTGVVRLDPPDPLDEPVGEAFNAHQQRVVGDDRLLGPAAPEAAATAFRDRGVEVVSAPSPWLLGGAESALTAAWFDGWLGAALEQRPELAARTRAYAVRRARLAASGELSVTVHHRDLLARPS